MTVLFTIAGLHPESGGPSHSVPALCRALDRDGVEVEIISLDYGKSRWGEATDEPALARQSEATAAREDALPTANPDYAPPPLPALSPALSGGEGGRRPGEETLVSNRTSVPQPSTLNQQPSFHTTFVECSSVLARRTQWTPRFKSVLRDRCRAVGAQLIHDTGVWLATNHAAAVVAAQLQVPRIVSPRGMLTLWSLRHKGWKKRIAWALYQHQDLETAQVLHATSPAEVADFRAAGLRQPVAMIPNGVELPSLEDGRWRMEDRSSRDARVALFLSRIHPKKGLPDLLKAWALVRPTGWRVVIAGGDEGGHAEELKAEIRKLKLEGDFHFMGPVEGEGKWKLFREADLFVLPSHSENFGIVVAEALAAGVPVITTRATPWEELVTHRCGWWTENGSEPLAAALRHALNRTDEDRREMGWRGRQLIEQKYSWPGIAAQMHDVYRWMLGEGEKPECVAVK